MSQLIPYLYFDGNCEEAITFYQSVLGGQIPYMGRYKDMPPSEESNGKIAGADGDKIMHVSLVSEGFSILASDVPKDYAGANYKQGTNVALSINAQSREKAAEIFNGLSTGGTVTMPLQDTFWGAFFGMWTDKFGINWMVNYDDPAKMQQHG